MAKETLLETPESKRDFERSFMWPLVYTPLLWIGLIHLGTRLMWFLGFK